jgi:hypothetical protein
MPQFPCRNVNLKLTNTGHQTVLAAGVPGFNPFQDYENYDFRTHHTNTDTRDHVKPEDIRQSAIIMASFAVAGRGAGPAPAAPAGSELRCAARTTPRPCVRKPSEIFLNEYSLLAYPAGHMIYLTVDALKQFKADAAGFCFRSVQSPAAGNGSR